MGTRSIIAIPDGDGWRGRYCHYDGYPTGVGMTLTALVNRDGIRAVQRIIVLEHAGWSGLDLAQPSQEQLETTPPDRDAPWDSIEKQASLWQNMFADGRFAAIEGYGVAYTTTVLANGYQQARMNDWILPDGAKWGTEWLYVLGDSGLLVGKVEGDTVRPLGLVRYDDDLGRWAQVEINGREEAA
jgi:hypothetical protein